MASPAWCGCVLKDGCLKQRFFKVACVVFVSSLALSFCVFFQVHAESPSGVQIVDSSGKVGLYASLALDSIDQAGISYYDFTNNDLKYASWTGSGWNIQTVDSEGFVGLHTSIVFDSNDNPHISYDGNNALKYASWNGSGWDIQIVDSSGGGSFTSISLDKNGNPHISYFHPASGGRLKYAQWTGSFWSTEIVDSAQLAGEFTSLALDAEGNPHISYYDISNGNLKYARRGGSGWNIQTVDAAGDVGTFSSLVLDSSAIAHIAYCDVSNGDLKYAESAGSSWNIKVVDSGKCVDSSLALDSSGQPHISYADNSDHRLKYAFWNGSDWIIQTLGSAGYVGEYTSISEHFTSLELDSNDVARIALCDSSYRLKYAHAESPAGFLANYVQTTATLSVEPNPIGIGQVAWIHQSVTPLPPSSSETFSGYTLTITKPDGSVIVEGPYASAEHDHLPSSVLKPDTLGTYTLRLSYSGQYFASQDVNYLPSQSEIVIVYVQKEPVPKIWYIDGSPSEFASYSQISPAIREANPGDTLYVRSGTYHGGFTVDKELTLIGETPLTTIINGISYQFTTDITISANNVNMTGFTVNGTRSLQVIGSNCYFFHNNFMDSIQVVSNSSNFWDNGEEGNYWSDYPGTDSDGDGIGDTPYIIDANNIDRYPLMNPFSDYIPPPRPSSNPPPSSTPAPTATPVFPSVLQQKGLTILRDVVGLDVSRYSVKAEENQLTGPDGVTQEGVFYTFTADSSKLTALLEFTHGNLMMIQVLDNEGPLYLTNPQTNINPLELAKVFLKKYQTYTGDPIYGQLAGMLEGMYFIPSNFTKASGNAVLEVTNSDGECPWFKWYYTTNGARAPYSKFISLGFKNGFLEAFVDKWQLYAIGNDEVNISEKEAIAIALEAAKSHSWSLKLDNDTFSPENFGEKNVAWTALVFDGGLDTDETHGGGSLTLYPVWRVAIALNKWYGSMYGVEVDIWADTGGIRSVKEAWSLMPPPEGSETAGTDSSSTSTSPDPTNSPATSPSPSPIGVAPEFPLLWILPIAIVATLVGGLIFRAKNFKGGEA